MKQSINFSQFTDQFNAIRPDNFSYDGLKAMFDFFEDWDEETGEETELDVIAICVEFSEYDSAIDCIETARYDFEFDEDWDEDEREENALDYLDDNTIVIPFKGGIIIQDY